MPSGSLKGPTGLSACNTPIPPPASAKYKKNLGLPSISFQAAAGAHELCAHFALPSVEATRISPWSVKFAISLVDTTRIVLILLYEFSLIIPSPSYS